MGVIGENSGKTNVGIRGIIGRIKESEEVENRWEITGIVRVEA